MYKAQKAYVTSSRVCVTCKWLW